MVVMVAPNVGHCEGECGSHEEMSAMRSKIAMTRTRMRRMANMQGFGMFLHTIYDIVCVCVCIATLCHVAMPPLPALP